MEKTGNNPRRGICLGQMFSAAAKNREWRPS